MKKITIAFAIFVAICVVAGVGSSCSRNVFDYDTYDSIVEIKSPVDTVDPNHTWTLSTKKFVIITVNGGVGAKKLQVLTDDPTTSKKAAVLAQNIVEEGDRFSMNVSFPTYLKNLYYAVIDEAGAYTIVKASTSQRDIDFSNPLVKSQKLTYVPDLYYYAFCYEQEMPEPGDYDYNDVVMDLALERVSKTEVYIHVKLAAVGASEQLAGLIRFPYTVKNDSTALITMDDIDSLYTIGGKSFDVNMHGEQIKQQNSIVEDSKLLGNLLLTGKKGEPIINLFADAHWAIGDVRNNEYGVFARKRYNVDYGTTTTTAELQPREIIFAMKVKDPIQLSYLTLEDIDPFVMRLYGNSRREVHTYPYRSVDALYENKYVELEHLPWALVIPFGGFYHPLHGQNIGFRMKKDYNEGAEILFGAYQERGHSFGEWSVNRNKCIDWFLNEYAYKSFVYVW